ncbi:MAG: OmpH family outer membrane protein [Alphaproteobacteria bacterium]|nr:OmpH family outer membrane protein [Alphaproteobacteria bacterium]
MRYFLIFSFIITSFISNTLYGKEKLQQIAIVDLRRVAAESKAGKGIDSQADDKNKESKKEFSDLEEKIKSMESSKLSGSDPRKIEELQLILYDMVKERRFQISEAYKIAIAKLEEIVKEAIKEIASEKGIDIVLIADAVIFSGVSCKDITVEVIDRVNKKCEHISLKVIGNKNA